MYRIFCRVPKSSTGFPTENPVKPPLSCRRVWLLVGGMRESVAVSRRRQNTPKQVGAGRVPRGQRRRTHEPRRCHSTIYGERSRSVLDMSRELAAGAMKIYRLTFSIYFILFYVCGRLNNESATKVHNGAVATCLYA